jgi:hypothetical protein
MDTRCCPKAGGPTVEIARLELVGVACERGDFAHP